MTERVKEIRKRLFKSFTNLRKLGWICESNWTCCSTCGWYELKFENNIDTPEKENELKAIFYHSQDEETFIENGKVYLAWTTPFKHDPNLKKESDDWLSNFEKGIKEGKWKKEDFETPNQFNKHTNELLNEFEKVGLTWDWNYKDKTRIQITDLAEPKITKLKQQGDTMSYSQYDYRYDNIVDDSNPTIQNRININEVLSEKVSKVLDENVMMKSNESYTKKLGLVLSILK